MRALRLVVLVAGCSSTSPPPPAPPATATAPAEASTRPPDVSAPPAPIEASLSTRAGSGSGAVVQEREDQTGIYGGIATDWGGDRELPRSRDPFSQQLADDLRRAWHAPSASVTTTPVACIHLTPDGTIVDTKLKESSGDDALDNAARRAVETVKTDRNANPRPVPTHLLALTTQWLCVRFDPNKR